MRLWVLLLLVLSHLTFWFARFIALEFESGPTKRQSLASHMALFRLLFSISAVSACRLWLCRLWLCRLLRCGKVNPVKGVFGILRVLSKNQRRAGSQ